SDQPGAADNAEGRAADWVLSLGGTVLVRVAGQEKKVGAGEKLPMEGFELLQIYVNEKAVTDAGLVNLKGLTDLNHLNLGGTDVTDAGLVHLKGLTNLKFLNLGG